MLWGSVFAVWMVLVFMRELKRSPSFSDDFRTLKSGGQTFRVDWATGVIRELNQSMETYRPVAGELPAGMRAPEPVNRREQPDLGVRYHNVGETFMLEYPGGRLPFRFTMSQGVIGHYYFSETEGRRLCAIWITGRQEKTGRLLSLRIELPGKKYDHPIEHPDAAQARKQLNGTSPVGLVPAFGLGWIIGSQWLATGFLAGVGGGAVVAVAYLIAISRIEARRSERFDGEQMSALREFVGQAHAAPRDPSTAPT